MNENDTNKSVNMLTESSLGDLLGNSGVRLIKGLNASVKDLLMPRGWAGVEL